MCTLHPMARQTHHNIMNEDVIRTPSSFSVVVFVFFKLFSTGVHLFEATHKALDVCIDRRREEEAFNPSRKLLVRQSCRVIGIT